MFEGVESDNSILDGAARGRGEIEYSILSTKIAPQKLTRDIFERQATKSRGGVNCFDRGIQLRQGGPGVAN